MDIENEQILSPIKPSKTPSGSFIHKEEKINWNLSLTTESSYKIEINEKDQYI